MPLRKPPAGAEAPASPDGVAGGLAWRTWTSPADGGAVPLVLAHGFTQNAEAWGPLPRLLAASRPVMAVDLPGHGRCSSLSADLPQAARLLGVTGGFGDYLGYSMGGRVALHLALDQPTVVRRLVLIGATAGIDDAEERRRRRLADEALADELDPPDPGSASQQQQRLEQFLQRWLAGPLFASLAPEAACLEARRANRCSGLAASLRTCGTGTQQPLWDRLGQLDMPVLVVAGADDSRFAAIGRRLAQTIGPNARLALVSAAGHACHLQRPEAVAELVDGFLR